MFTDDVVVVVVKVASTLRKLKYFSWNIFLVFNGIKLLVALIIMINSKTPWGADPPPFIKKGKFELESIIEII